MNLDRKFAESDRGAGGRGGSRETFQPADSASLFGNNNLYAIQIDMFSLVYLGLPAVENGNFAII
jgi:hypothetical protein